MPAVLTTENYQRAAVALGCSLAAIRAVAEVEAPRGGFDDDGDPRTLFEGHIFHALTGGAFGVSHPTLSYPRWTKNFYGRNAFEEKERLRKAQRLNFEAACKAASWGKFQVLGKNFVAAGFASIEDFVAAMKESEARHLDAFCAFIRSEGLADELQRQDWAGFARRYNGPRYAENQYDTKMAAAFAKWSTH